MQNFMTAILFILSVFVTPVMVLSQSPSEGGPRLVIIPPWKSASAIITRSGGALVGPYVAPFAVLASFDNSQSEQHALRLGAWAILDGRKIFEICGGSDVR